MAKVAAEALDPGHADTAVKPAIAMERTAETAKKPAAAATDDCFRMSRSPPRTGRERCAPAHRTFRSMFVLTPVTAPHSRQYRNALRARLYTLRSEDLVKTAFLFRPGWSAGSGHVSRSAEVRDTELLPGVDLRERTVRDRQAQRRGDRCPAVTRAPFEQPLRWRLGANVSSDTLPTPAGPALGVKSGGRHACVWPRGVQPPADARLPARPAGLVRPPERQPAGVPPSRRGAMRQPFGIMTG